MAADPKDFSYTIAKSALWTATQTLAQALAPRIRVNAIGPGPVLPNRRQSEAEFERECRATLLGRATTMEEICRGRTLPARHAIGDRPDDRPR